MISIKSTLCLATLLGLAALATHISAQDEAPTTFGGSTFINSAVPATANVPDLENRPSANVSVPTVDASKEHLNTRKRIVTRYVQEIIYDPIPADELEEAKKFENAVQQYKDSNNEEEKSNLATLIQQLLERQFERDLKRREEELTPIEARVRSLRKQLDTRRESMKDIIDLRFKTIVNSIDGLGFPDDDGRFSLPRTDQGKRDTQNSNLIRGFVPKDGSKATKNESKAKPRTRKTTKDGKAAEQPSEDNSADPVNDDPMPTKS